MKAKLMFRGLALLALLLSTLNPRLSTAHAQGATFTYQGRLNDGANPANGSYDLCFTLYDASSGGTVQGEALTNAPTTVSNGLFTVALDFGAGVFTGADRWLDIGVRTNGGGGFTSLTPRQFISTTPYAVRAASFSGPVNTGQLTGTIAPANIAAGSVTGPMLANGSVTTAALADGAVTSAKVFSSFNLLSTLALTNPTPLALDQFGFAVAAVGPDKILVGANLDDAGANNAGAAHLFDSAGHLLLTLTNPTPSADDNFGQVVGAIGPDQMLIGAFQDDTGALNAGSAYLFSPDGALLLTLTNPSPAVGDGFGYAVAAVGGDKFIIGAFRDNPGSGQLGAAYLYDLAGNLVQVFTNPTPAHLDQFGSAVAAVDPHQVLIGAPGDDTGAGNAGAAYLFATNGALLTTFTNPTPVASDAFGTAVVTVGADKVLISAPADDTGATDAGAAYLFDLTGNLLMTFKNPAPSASDQFGRSLTAVGTMRVLIGASLDDAGTGNAGTAYLFDLAGNLVQTFTNPAPATGDQFAAAVAAFDENRIIVGTLQADLGGVNAGGAYVFSFDTFTPGLLADRVRFGSVTAANLAPGTAVANLAASGQSAVPSGGIILSGSANDTNLASAGYVNIGNSNFGERWQRRAGGEPAAPSPRRNHSAVWTGSEMIIWGGFDGSAFFNSGSRYDPATGNWTPTSLTLAPERRSEHSAVWTGTEMIVWGGGAGGGLLRNDGGRYDPVADSWQPTSTVNPPAGRIRHTEVWTGDRMIVWGGVDGTNFLNSGGMYFPSLNTWSNLATTGAPSGRADHTAVWDGAQRMIVWGGADGTNTVSTGAIFSTGSLGWSASTPPVGAPAARYRHSAVWTGGEMIVWGGNDGNADNNLNTGARFQLAGNVWTALPTNGVPAPRSRHTAVWTGNEMIVQGGFGGGSRSARYNLATDTWKAVTDFNDPGGRGFSTAVWTGSEMIVWGGSTAESSSSGFLDTGGSYSPADDHWTTTRTTLGYPPLESAFYDRTAVWTGAELILWGGVDYSAADDAAVARYHPATDTWTTISTNNMPMEPGRNGHSAIWTGTEMIVWGGRSHGQITINTGGRYNPISDVWTKMSTNSAPSRRRDHTAVWTGSEMIIWGGQGQFAFGSGGRYSPATDSWLPTSLVNVPQAGGRYDHTAIWTGSEMIVWGGVPGSGVTADGGRYHPATDSWIQTSLSGAPTGRFGHTAVWTGSEMIVWGGRDNAFTTRFNSGGRYDPERDVWRSTSINNAPSARSDHVSVWTGTEMITWGGVDTNSSTPVGGRYNPQTDDWAETTPTGAPAARNSHLAVWTGREMIIVGGRTTSVDNFNDTYSYTPPKVMYLYLKP